MSRVKGVRRYDSSRRREQARRTREKVLDVAEKRFLAKGYATVTVAEIAGKAGVSVETVYKLFGGKPGMVRAIYEKGLLGRDSEPAYERSDEMRAREKDPRIILSEWGTLTAEVASQVTPIRLLIRSAAETDPDMAKVLADNDKDRLKRMRHHARFLAERGYLRDGITVAVATDILWTCSSAELYESLVLKRGWSLKRFARFVEDMMIATLLPHKD